MQSAKSSIESYLARMLTMQVKSATKNGVKMTIQVVPDAYLYYMAKIYRDYEGLGLSEDSWRKSWEAPTPSTSVFKTVSSSGSPSQARAENTLSLIRAWRITSR